MKRNELVEKISRLEKELQTAGKIHRRYVGKHLHRCKKELMIYDRYMAKQKAL